MDARAGSIEICPLEGIGEVGPGDDLAAMLARALRGLYRKISPYDVLVVTSKVVSKAEGRFVDLTSVRPGPEALQLAEKTLKDPRLVELVLRESAAVVRAVPHVLITRHRLGHVMANAGIDQSNTGGREIERALLLPLDPDASATALSNALAAHLPQVPAIVISDSFGRPWRNGVTNVAIGASGLPSLIDRRGEIDRDGRVLEVTQIAFADMLATTAGLATGEGAEGIPAALIRGCRWDKPAAPATALVRPPEQDLFR